MFSCRLRILRAGDAEEVRQHAPWVGALCVAEADGVGHRVRHAQHLQTAVRLRGQQQPRQILRAEARTHAARAQLERRDGRRERLLRDVQRIGRARVAALACEREKVIKGRKVYAATSEIYSFYLWNISKTTVLQWKNLGL